MTAARFRQLALAVQGSVESSHMEHPDFRLDGKVFATLGYPDNDWAMVKLAEANQNEFTAKNPAVYAPCKGPWGRRGATQVLLAAAQVGDIRAALRAAARHLASKKTSRPRRLPS